MADKKEYHDFIFAYALGCLDESDLVDLKNFLDSNEDFFWQELGEYQNLSSLLPSILAIENPLPEVKDKVARKLYRIRNEIKAKRDQARKEKKILPHSGHFVKSKPVENKKVEKEIEQINADVHKEKTESFHKVIDTEKGKLSPAAARVKPEVEGFEVVSSLRRTADLPASQIKGTEEKPHSKDEHKREKKEEPLLNFEEARITAGENEIDTISELTEPLKPVEKTSEEQVSEKEAPPKKLKETSEKEKVRKKSGLYIVIVLLAILILIIGMVFFYLRVSSDVKKYEARINSLNNEISNLSDQFKLNRELQVVLSSKNLKTVNLEGTNLAQGSFGKIFINPETNRGFIQLSNIPALPANEIYQLWINISGNYTSVCKIRPSDNFTYFPIELPQLNNNIKISFQLTGEPADGSLQPGSKVFLNGILK